jgi:hypothetical protein
MAERLSALTTPPSRPLDRGLFDIVLRAFYQACDQSDLEVAMSLLDVLTDLVVSSDTSHRDDRRQSEHDLRIAQGFLMRIAAR